MCEVGSVRRLSPSGMGLVGVYLSCAKQKAEGRKQKERTNSTLLPRCFLLSAFCFLLLIIWCSTADPVADEFDLRIIEVGAALRHAIAGDAGAGDLAIEVRARRIAGHHALHGADLRARRVHDLRVRASRREDELLLLTERVMTAELRAGRREDLVLNAGEGRSRIDRLTPRATRLGRQLLQL